MLRTVTQVLKRRYCGKYLCYVVKPENNYSSQLLVLKKTNFVPVYCYGTKTLVSEEDTLNYKVLEHIRERSEYITSKPLQENQFPLSNVTDMKYAIEKTLLVIGHNPEAKVSEILKLFSLYASSGLFVMQDVIANKTLMKNVQNKVISCIKFMNVQELRHLAVLVRALRHQKTGYLGSIRGSLANQCEVKALESDFPEILQLFDILLILYGNSVYHRKEYETFVSLFENYSSSADPHELVQVLHYVGLGKKKRLSREFVVDIIQKLEPKFSDLSFCDAGIALSGVFKSGVNLDQSCPMVQQTVQHLLKRMDDPCVMTDLDSYAFVSMIKVLRTSKHENEEFFHTLSEYICKNSQIPLTPQVIPHILAFYANNRIYDIELFSRLEKMSMEFLKGQTSQVRIRDLSRLLWSFSHTGHNCHPQLYTLIEKCLSFIEGSQMTNDHYLSDSLLSLVMCGHYAKDLIKNAFMPARITGLKGHQRSKQLSRLITLYEALKIEAPDLIDEKPQLSQEDLPVRTLSDEIYHRPGLSKVMEGVGCINEILGANVMKLKFLLPSINYANLIVDFDHLKSVENTSSCDSFVERNHIKEQLSALEERSNSLVAIEILEPHFLIRPSSEPIGIIRLKLRLLRKSGWNIRILSCSELEDCGNDTRAIAALLLDKVTKC